MTIVVCNTDQSKRIDPLALKLLNYESAHQVLEVKDPGFAEVLHMEPGKIYFYYKPSIVNGFNQATIDEFVNIEAAQILNKDLCRGTLQVREGNLTKLKEEIKDVVMTEGLANSIYQDVFEVVQNETFVFNPNMRSFKRKLQQARRGNRIASDRPLLFIFFPQQYMNYTEKQILRALNPEGGQESGSIFDIYYTDDKEFAKQFFCTKNYPPVIPVITILDPST